MTTAKADASEEQILRSSGALPIGFTPSTDLGWRLVRLRAKSISDGGKFLSEEELEQKIAALRD
jgi:hypothetical protein